MVRSQKNIPFCILIVLCLSCLLLLMPIILPGCSGDDDDDDNNDNNDDTAAGIAGVWNVTMTVQLDTCYGFSTGETLTDTWTIEQDDLAITITDNEGDSYSGAYQEHSFGASYEGTQSDGGCIMDVSIIINGSTDNDEVTINGTMSAVIETQTPDECGFSSCVTSMTFVATRI